MTEQKLSYTHCLSEENFLKGRVTLSWRRTIMDEAHNLIESTMGQVFLSHFTDEESEAQARLDS